jgi:hypothetical protein
MDKKSTLSFALSQEQLFVILAYLHANALAGLEEELVNGLSAREKTLVMGVAERSLVARGFLVGDVNHRLKLSDPVSAVVGPCAFPERSTLVRTTRSQGVEETFYFHSARKMHILHTLPFTAIHQFIAVESPTEFVKAILSTLHLPELEELDVPAGMVPARVLIEARDVSSKGKNDQAVTVFTKAGMERSTANRLIEAFARPELNATFSSVEGAGDGQKVEGFSILQGQNSLWLLTPDQNVDQIRINSLSTRAVIERIRSIIDHEPRPR